LLFSCIGKQLLIFIKRETLMIHISGLHKSYGDVQALRDVSLDIAQGEIVGLLGPNGAGKTTMMKILTGYLQPDEGKVLVDNRDVLDQTAAVQSRIGYLPENAPLYPELTVQAYLQMMADLRQIPPAEQPTRLAEAVRAVALGPYLRRPISQLSKGYRQRVGLAQAIIHRPQLLILDEPTVGLDPTQIVEIRELIRKLAEHSTILFSTHILPEVELLCDRVIILLNGEVRADARLSELAGGSDAILVLETAGEAVADQLAALPGVAGVTPFTTAASYPAFRLQADADADLTPAVYALARERDWPLRELRRDVRDLETVFNELALAA
jgi:ABC-2 type transport system ATP-binding protein